ncbi:hypothetical protein CMUS01_05201 [Colletotrichum musicola]|uniref:AT hook domain-containing protein n=1 Tax=Colletotrichum musicola TaxID=2175873 RepID=A0A8H6KSW2_9PEZI|nr:hypothetical protein CMUS01_05201 [Colletotrichum musicola]
MAYSFTDVEKRFILAEVIKTSNLDVGRLVEFLRSYNVEPDWLKMQLPGGRTMEQCISVTGQMFRGPMRMPDLKRKAVNDLLEHPPKRPAMASPMEPPAQLPMPSPLAPASQGSATYSNLMPISSILPAPAQLHNTTLANIQPRPANVGMDAGKVSNRFPSPIQSQQQQQPPPPPPAVPPARKRGRPSRADKARQLRPVLPQHLTPLAPAPPPRPPARESPGTPAEGSVYSLSPGPASETPNEGPKRKRGRPRSVDKAQPARGPRPLAMQQVEPDRSLYKTEQPTVHSGSLTPNDVPRSRPDETPRDSYAEHGQHPETQKERAIPHIGHLTQEGLAR